jgi:hypothetical protein
MFREGKMKILALQYNQIWCVTRERRLPNSKLSKLTVSK